MSQIRKYLQLLESAMNEEIIIDHDHGSAEGYETETTSAQFQNWFENRHKIYDDALMDKLRSELNSVVFLNNINVDDEHRGQGYGSEILEDFISDASSHYPDGILLLSDAEEEQQDGFDLVKFYEGYDFEAIARFSAGTLMLLRM